MFERILISFKCQKEGFPSHVAGWPPDCFSEYGQLWGNPIYSWDVHKKDNYPWWTERLHSNFKLYNMVGLDHFRGFAYLLLY